MTRIRRLWFWVLIRLPGDGSRIGACRRFVPDPNGSLPNHYCRVCEYDIDLHRARGSA